jgi:hypothetical protein
MHPLMGTITRGAKPSFVIVSKIHDIPPPNDTDICSIIKIWQTQTMTILMAKRAEGAIGALSSQFREDTIFVYLELLASAGHRIRMSPLSVIRSF